MHVKNLTLHNFRDYADLEFTPGSGLNILFGRNAQGKTSLLEAIYILATSRSWRAGRDYELVRWETPISRIWSEIERDAQNDVEIEITFGRTEKKRVSLNTVRKSRLSDFLGHVNVVLIEPHDVDIVRGEPSGRRRFINLELSQIQPQYCHLMANYRRILDQRNQLLKNIQQGRGADALLHVLTEQLVTCGSGIVERRLRFLQRIGETGRRLHGEITEGEEDLSIEYRSSICPESGDGNSGEIAEKFMSVLNKKRDEEIRRGVTLAGPQRDDLAFKINGIDSRVYGSQGQQRTIALSLRLAELEVMEDLASEPPIVLLDDVMTDLDEGRRQHVFRLTNGRCQTFITAASRNSFDGCFLSSGKVFGVEKGTVTEE